MERKRDECNKKAVDNKNTVLKREQYKEARKFMDRRIDMLNYKFNKPIETKEGERILEKIKRAQAWLPKRIWYKFKDKFLSVDSVVTVLMGYVGTAIAMAFHKTAQVTYRTAKDYVLPAAIHLAGSVSGQALVKTVLAVPEFLLWVSDHIVQFIIGAISFSLFLHQEYGEEASFPILAFWAYILAMSMYALHHVHETYKSAKSYIPFMGGDSR